MAQAGQEGCGCPVPGTVKDQVRPEQPGLTGGNPVHGRVTGKRLYLMYLPTQDIHS